MNVQIISCGVFFCFVFYFFIYYFYFFSSDCALVLGVLGVVVCMVYVLMAGIGCQPSDVQ